MGKPAAKKGRRLPTGMGPEGARLFHDLSAAVEKTIATLPEVVAVLGLPTDGAIRVVTLLASRTDEAILRVAEQELALMDEMPALGFDFRTADADDLGAYVTDGFAPIVERRGHDEPPTA